MTNEEKRNILKKVLRFTYGDDFVEDVFIAETKDYVTDEYVRGIVFDHEFANSLFGEDYIYKLKEMVAYKNPLEYINKYVNNKISYSKQYILHLVLIRKPNNIIGEYKVDFDTVQEAINYFNEVKSSPKKVDYYDAHIWDLKEDKLIIRLK